MYENLISDIRAAIKANGNQEITGPILQDVLVGIVNALGAGVPCGGVLSPGDTPATQQPIFYLAGPGTYNAAGLTTLGEGCIGLTIFDGSSWSADTIDTGLAGAVSTINDALAAINATLPNKMDKVPSAIENRFPQFNSGGGVKDGGFEAVEHISKDATNKHLPTEKAVREALTGKQELLVAGAAEGILGPSAATGLAQVLTAPSAGVSIVDAIKGRTLKWNQLLRGVDSPHPAISTYDAETGIFTITTNGSASYTEYKLDTSAAFVAGHIYVGIVQVISNADDILNYTFAQAAGNSQEGMKVTITSPGVGIFTQRNTSTYSGGFRLLLSLRNNTVSGRTAQFRFNVFDLTDLFGAGDEPATVAEFTALFPNFPYAYNTGTLLPFKGTALKVTGQNQWDEQWVVGLLNSDGSITSGETTRRTSSFIDVLPGVTYYQKCPSSAGGGRVAYYDKSKNLVAFNPNGLAANNTFVVPSNAYYVRISFGGSYGTAYNNDICINISNASLNGTYKPYTETLLNIDAVGKSAKDGDGNAIVPYPTGMNGTPTVYDVATKANGEVRMGIVDLGKQNWTKQTTGSGTTEGTTPFFRTTISDMKRATGQVVCQSYIYANSGDKRMNTIEWSAARQLNIWDSAFDNSTAAEFKAAMDGVYLVYQFDTPVPFTWDEPFTLAFTAEEGGTIWLQPEGVDAQGVPATAPMNLDIAYTTPAVSIITETTLRNLLDQFKAAGKIASYTMTPDGNGNFNFTIS